MSHLLSGYVGFSLSQPLHAKHYAGSERISLGVETSVAQVPGFVKIWQADVACEPSLGWNKTPATR